MGDKHKIHRTERIKTYDFWATPDFVTEALLSVESFSGSIWEPACGQGHISEVLRAHDLGDVYSSDLIDRGYGETPIDFLDTYRDVENVVTNPPFQCVGNIHLFFAAHALYVARQKVAMLLPMYFVDTPRRRRFLARSPLKAIYVFSYRVWAMQDGKTGNPADKFALCWFVWEKGWKDGPVLRWLHEGVKSHLQASRT